MPKSPDANEILRTQGEDALRQAFDDAVIFKPKATRGRANGPTAKPPLDKDNNRPFGEKPGMKRLSERAHSEEPPPPNSEADYTASAKQ